MFQKYTKTFLVIVIMVDFSKLIEMEREIMILASKPGDEGTSELINKFMQFKEKNNWMLRSFVGKNFKEGPPSGGPSLKSSPYR